MIVGIDGHRGGMISHTHTHRVMKYTRRLTGEHMEAFVEGMLALVLKVVLIFFSLKKVHFLVSQVYFGIIYLYTVYFAPIRGRARESFIP